MSYDDDTIYNDVTIDMGDVGKARRRNSGSVDLYGVRAMTRTLALANVNEGDDAADHLLARYATPRLRVREILIRPQRDETSWPAVLAIDIGSRITVTRTLPGDDFSQECTVEAITHTINARTRTWEVRYQLEPTINEVFWLLGTTGQSELGTNTYLSY